MFEGVTHVGQPTIVDVHVLDGVKGAPNCVLTIQEVMVVRSAYVAHVVEAIDRAIVVREVVVESMSQPLRERMTWLIGTIGRERPFPRQQCAVTGGWTDAKA